MYVFIHSFFLSFLLSFLKPRSHITQVGLELDLSASAHTHRGLQACAAMPSLDKVILKRMPILLFRANLSLSRLKAASAPD